jgi:hypothetical protein
VTESPPPAEASNDEPGHGRHEQDHVHHYHARVEGKHSRILQICEAVVLALVTLTAAWSGYAAAKWGTQSRLELAAAASDGTQASRADLTALTLRNFDASTFNAWFIAYTLDNQQKMGIAERRFRPQFRVAFDAWMATDPNTNPDAPPGPTYMPQYHLPQEAQAQALESAGAKLTAQGDRAGVVGDNYVRIAVVLAGVLFLVGIGSTFTIAGVRYALVGVGAALLIGAVALILSQPAPPA